MEARFWILCCTPEFTFFSFALLFPGNTTQIQPQAFFIFIFYFFPTCVKISGTTAYRLVRGGRAGALYHKVIGQPRAGPYCFVTGALPSKVHTPNPVFSQILRVFLLIRYAWVARGLRCVAGVSGSVNIQSPNHCAFPGVALLVFSFSCWIRNCPVC